MKQLTLLAACMILLSLVVRPAIADQQGSLRWVGCGISKKAYMVALAEAYEKKTGTKIDLEGGGATRGIREVAASTADIGGSCRRRMFRAEDERGVTQVPVAWDALVVIVNKSNPVQNISLDDLRKVYLGQVSN
jgi:phosphate transport system substrate-binding protein